MRERQESTCISLSALMAVGYSSETRYKPESLTSKGFCDIKVLLGSTTHLGLL
jgi:hypothetical protein